MQGAADDARKIAKEAKDAQESAEAELAAELDRTQALEEQNVEQSRKATEDLASAKKINMRLKTRADEAHEAIDVANQAQKTAESNLAAEKDITRKLKGVIAERREELDTAQTELADEKEGYDGLREELDEALAEIDELKKKARAK